MKTLSSFLRGYAGLCIGVCILFLASVIFTETTRGKELSAQFFDPSRNTVERKEVVIVGIDDKSLQKLGAWPWKRDVFASLHKKFNEAGAKVVVYDILFLEEREGDSLFKKELEKSNAQTILASKVDNENYLESFFISQAPTIKSAIANVQADSDGKVRRFAKPFYKEGGDCIQTLSNLGFLLYTNKDFSCDKEDSFFRHTYTIQTISLVDVLEGKVDISTLKDKVILVGSVTVDLPDHFVGLSGEKIAGVYMHGSMITSLLNNDIDRNLSYSATLIILALYTLITVVVFFVFRRLFSQDFSLLILFASVFIVADILYQNNLILNAPSILLTTTLTAGYTIIFRFLRERKQNEYIKNIFSRYVHKDVLQELLKSGSQIKLGGERKEVSILFSDLRGFTTFSEKMEAEELTRLLNQYLTAMSPIILEEKGTIDKYIGDAIMAFWNAPLEIKDHATCATRSALRMQEALSKFNKQHKTSLAMGIGIHTGEVIVGNVGSLERINYTILGDVVNNTSRLEGITKKYGVGIIATEELKEKVSDPSILFRKLDIITVKGKTLPTHIYEVLFFEGKKRDVVSRYEAAFLLYQKGNFEEARTLFETLQKEGDAPSIIMLERINSLTDEQKSAWDGVWRFDEK